MQSYPGKGLLGSILLMAGMTAFAFDTSTSAVTDLSCAGTRKGSSMNCTANEFAVNPSFSAAPGTDPFCVAGQEFEFIVDLELSGANTDRYDAGFFVGQTGNEPAVNDATKQCSVATFPLSSPGSAWWFDSTGGVGPNTCGDFAGASGRSSIVRVDKIKVVCQSDGLSGDLLIPYVLTYNNGSGEVCTGPTDVVNSVVSKCIKGNAKVDGVESIAVGAWLDVIKQTSPDGNTENFTYTATGPVGSKIMALVGATFGPGDTYSGGSYVGPGGAPITLFTATNTAEFTLQDGQQARVFIAATNTAQTLTVVESLAAGWDPDAFSIACSNTHGTPITDLDGDVITRTVTADLSITNYAGSCTITNRKRPAVTITKISNGDVGTFNFTGTNTWSSQDITTTTSGVSVAGVTQYLPVGVATTITETAAAGYRMEDISCTTSAGTATVDTAARTVSFDAAAMGAGETINCTYTNRRQRTLTAVINLDPAPDPGSFVVTSNGVNSTAGGNGTSVSATVDALSTINFSGAGSGGTLLANYDITWSCDTVPTATTGTGASGSFAMPNLDITCTFDLVRKKVQLYLEKTWVNGIVGDTATAISTGFINDVSSGVSVSSGNNTTTGSWEWVYAGESATLSESFSVGNSNNYNAGLACDSGANLVGDLLTITDLDKDKTIYCTYTNTRKTASLVLAKAWENAIVGNAIDFTATGLTALTSTADSANETDIAAAQTVYAGSDYTLAENFTSGNSGDYGSSLACSNNSSALVGNVLTIVAGDESNTITCTYGNSRPGPNLSVTKTVNVIDDVVSAANDKAIPGATLRYTITLQNTSAVYGSDTVNLVDNFDDENLQYVPGSAVASNGAVVSVTDSDSLNNEDLLEVNTSVPASGTVTVTFDVLVK